MDWTLFVIVRLVLTFVLRYSYRTRAITSDLVQQNNLYNVQKVVW